MLPPVDWKKTEGNRLAPSLSVTDIIDRVTVVKYVKVIALHSRASPCSGRSGA
jgi:hypothetical protein